MGEVAPEGQGEVYCAKRDVGLGTSHVHLDDVLFRSWSALQDDSNSDFDAGGYLGNSRVVSRFGMKQLLILAKLALASGG
jgi:hypothetical protein